MQHSKAETVRRFPECGSFLAFVEDFLLRNEPCLFGEKATQGWKARALWQNEGRPDLDYLTQEFGNKLIICTTPHADCAFIREVRLIQRSYLSHSKPYWHIIGR